MTLTNKDLFAISRLLDTKLCAGLKLMEIVFEDVELIRDVVTGHSEKIQKLA